MIFFNLKQYRLLFFIYIIFLLLSPTLHAWQHDLETPWDDEIGIDVLDELDNNTDWAKMTRAADCIDAFDAVTLLTDNATGIEAQKVLLENLYKRTNPINIRSLHDLPEFYYRYCCPTLDDFCRSRQLLVQPFYNHTAQQYFTKEGDTIQSYLALDNQNILQRIDQFAFNDRIPDVLAIFNNIKIEERRLGVMFGTMYDLGPWSIEWRTPLYEFERNFFLTETEQQKIENAKIFAVENTDFDDFKYMHLVSDKLGIGDTRVIVGRDLYCNDCLDLYGGLFTTVPTAFALYKGIIGSHFTGKLVPLNLLQIINLFLSDTKRNIPEGIDLTVNFLLGALDNLSAMLLEEKLGNGGHLGLGTFLENYISFTPCLSLYTRTALEYLCPAYEKRFYIEKKNEKDFLNRDYTNPDLAHENLAFLNTQLIETLYPRPFRTLVRPGFIFRFNSTLGYQRSCWDFRLGYDFWWQDKETLGTIRTPGLDFVQNAKLRKKLAVKSSAMQQKITSAIIYNKKGKKYDWCVALQADKTFLSFGIGEDFNISLRFEINV